MTSSVALSYLGLCCICHEGLTSELVALHCGHIFHSACVETWLNVASNCPMCKSTVRRRGAKGYEIIPLFCGEFDESSKQTEHQDTIKELQSLEAAKSHLYQLSAQLEQATAGLKRLQKEHEGVLTQLRAADETELELREQAEHARKEEQRLEKDILQKRRIIQRQEEALIRFENKIKNMKIEIANFRAVGAVANYLENGNLNTALRDLRLSSNGLSVEQRFERVLRLAHSQHTLVNQRSEELKKAHSETRKAIGKVERARQRESAATERKIHYKKLYEAKLKLLQTKNVEIGRLRSIIAEAGLDGAYMVEASYSNRNENECFDHHTKHVPFIDSSNASESQSSFIGCHSAKIRRDCSSPSPTIDSNIATSSFANIVNTSDVAGRKRRRRQICNESGTGTRILHDEVEQRALSDNDPPTHKSHFQNPYAVGNQREVMGNFMGHDDAQGSLPPPSDSALADYNCSQVNSNSKAFRKTADSVVPSESTNKGQSFQRVLPEQAKCNSPTRFQTNIKFAQNSSEIIDMTITSPSDGRYERMKNTSANGTSSQSDITPAEKQSRSRLSEAAVNLFSIQQQTKIGDTHSLSSSQASIEQKYTRTNLTFGTSADHDVALSADEDETENHPQSATWTWTGKTKPNLQNGHGLVQGELLVGFNIKGTMTEQNSSKATGTERRKPLQTQQASRRNSVGIQRWLTAQPQIPPGSGNTEWSNWKTFPASL